MTSNPAHEPLPFPSPKFVTGKRFSMPVHVPEVGEDVDDSSEGCGDVVYGPAMLIRSDSMAGNNVLARMDGEGEMPRKAYWIQRKLAKTTYGVVRVGYVLRPRTDDPDESGEEDDETGGRKRLRTSKSMKWEVVPLERDNEYEMVAIKMFDKKKMESIRAQRMEGPMVELCATQMMAAQEAESNHVLGSLDTLEDERFIYNVMPLTGDGDLFHYVKKVGRVEEAVARHFFRQILQSLQFLQRMGLCHRDVCAENILLRGSDCFVSGHSKCLRIP
uniref:Protein kinase domain-containing protein n=1 Tax=Pseudictyota dubia TaxID=2749911 RepID=A0A7R9Z7M0_9STRA